MKKKSLTLLITALALTSLAGCQNNKKNTTVSKQTGVGQVKTNKSGSDTDSNENNDSNSNTNSSTWDSEKQEKLDDFFDDWSDTMDQDYDKYEGSGQIKTAAGEEFPKEFDRVTLNGQKVSLAYEPDGKGDSDYNVVAIYNYDKDEGASHITYFFAFHNGQPVVLVDETTNGDEVQVKETANKDLINGFNAIAAGKNASMTDSGETDSDEDTDADNSENEDPKLIGTFIGLLKAGDWFKENVNHGHMYFSENSGTGKKKGFDCITTGGAPDSYYWFKQEGDEVIVKYSDTSNGHCVADGFYKTEKYSVDRLKQDYYVNSGQKQEVNGYVKKIKPIEDKD